MQDAAGLERMALDENQRISEVIEREQFGILALCRILFGGFGLHGSGRSSFRRRMTERWEHMTPEERERLRQGIREGCGFGPSTSESQEQ